MNARRDGETKQKKKTLLLIRTDYAVSGWKTSDKNL